MGGVSILRTGHLGWELHRVSYRLTRTLEGYGAIALLTTSVVLKGNTELLYLLSLALY